MTNAAFDPRKDALDRLAFVRRLFASDVQAMSPENLAYSGGGQSRCGYDFIFELVGFFDTMANLLVVGPSALGGAPEGWVRAPQEFHEKDSALKALQEAQDKFVANAEAYTGDFVNDNFPTAVGNFTPLGVAHLAAWHTMYHSGQLNYIQTVLGDAEFHWGG